MTRQLALVLIAGVVAAVLAAAGLAGTDPARSGDAAPERPAGPGAGLLDGLTFAAVLGPLEKPADVEDTLVFADGMFVSRECQRRCNYPAAPYFVRRRGAAVEFVSETRCADKDATIVWRGRVEDGAIAGEFTWTVSRWYWTIEKRFWFEGTLVRGTPPVASAG